MPNRILREGLLRSERYHALSDAARLAFVEIVLVADDWGLVELGPVALRMACPWAHGRSAEAIVRIIAELADADMIRTYERDGTLYGFLPRFNNSPRAKKPKYPDPPLGLCSGPAWAEDWPAVRAERAVPRLHSRCTADAQQMRAYAPETETETETETEKIPTGRDARQIGPSVAAELFGEGLAFLTQSGSSARGARSFLGMLRKRGGDALAVRILRRAIAERPSDPCGWMVATLELELASDPRAAAAEARRLIEAEKAGLQ